jgi:ATP-dependent helicase/nuclease subunit B
VRLVRLLEAGVIEPSPDGDLGASAAARILRQCGATLGRESYGAALAAFAASCEERSADLELDEDIRASYAMRATRARQLARWIASVFDAIPEPSGDLVALGTLLDGLERVLNDAASVGGQEDAAAKSAVMAALESLAPLRELRGAMSSHLALIRSQFESVMVAASRPSPSALHVSSLGSPSFAGRPVTFVVGLEEGAVFPAGMEDPVLLDDERRAIAPGCLGTSMDKTSAAVYRGISHLAGLRGAVTFSYSCRDLRQGRESYPSWLVFQAHQLLQPGSGLSHGVLAGWLGDPVTLVAPAQAAAITDVGWWLSGLRNAGTSAMPWVASAYPGIARGIKADEKRDSEEFTEYDGLVPAAGADLDPRRADQVFSASRFESFAKCPFRFFLERGLGLDPVEDEEPDPDAWLDPLTRGAALHEIYAAFLRRLREEKRRPVLADWKTLWELAREELARRRAEIPPPSESVYSTEIDQIERDLRLFLRLEIERNGAVPVAIEAPFGFGDAVSDEPLGQADPVEIDVGSGTIRLRGRIDRIDRLADGKFEVIDYKTGSPWKDYDGIFSGGRLLQHALYAIAAQKLLRCEQKNPRVKLSSYYFCTERGWGHWVSKPANVDVKTVLGDITEAIAAGEFVRGGEEHDCRFCDYGRACTAAEMEQAATKREALIPIGRLAEHE